MKWGSMLIFLYIMQLAMVVFMGTGGQFTESTNSTSLTNMYSSTLDTNSTMPSTWQFFINPTGWSGMNFIVTLGLIMGVIGAIGIGLYLLFRSDLALLFGFFVWMIGLGAIPIINLYILVTSEVGMYACAGATVNCAVGTLAGVLSAGFLGTMYIFACLGWWSNRMTE